MTGRMRWGVVGDNPVPWLGTAVAVLLVIALSWLATDDQAAATGSPAAPIAEARQGP